MDKGRKRNLKSTSEGSTSKPEKKSIPKDKAQALISFEQVSQQLNVGIEYFQTRKFSEAEACFKQVLELQPKNHDAWHLLGVIAAQQKQYSIAIESIERAINLNPTEAIFYHDLGNVYSEQGQFQQAIASYHHALQLKPDDLEAHIKLGNVYSEQGKLEKAIASYHHALQLKPDHVEAHIKLGNALKTKGKFKEAIALYHRALQLKPDHVDALIKLGNVFLEQGKLEEGMACYHHALQLKPDDAQTKIKICIGQLPIIYSTAEEIQLTRQNYEQHLQNLITYYETAPQTEQANASDSIGLIQPFYLAYQGYNDRDLQKTYGQLICQLMASRYPQWTEEVGLPQLAEDEKIRIGFVSGFFRYHSNWKIPIKGWIENLDKNQFELFGYHTGSIEDQFTARARESFVKFIQGPLPLEKWCEKIAQDKLHILIFPEFGMEMMTIKLGCLRLAPIQMTSWGHPNTSGLPTIDYYLSSDLMEPENAQDHYSEKLLRLPNLSIYYTPLEIQPKRINKAKIGIKQEETIFWCCQSIFKYLPQHDDVFPRIAKELAICKFVFIKYSKGEYVNEIFHQRLRGAFEEFGLNYQDYCIFLPKLDNNTFAGITAIADVFLDSIGWSGCNSTLEAINYNIPILTLPGELMRGRHTLAILKMMGIEETIAASKDEYIQMAIRLAQDDQYRQYISQQISENKHKLYGDLKPIRALEHFFLKAVQSSLDLPTVPINQPDQTPLNKDWLTEPVPKSVLIAVENTPGWLSLEEAALLYHLARKTTTGSIIEVGSYRGRSTVALSKGALAGGNRPIYAVEPHEEFQGCLGGQFGPEDRGIFYQSMLNTSSYQNVRLVNLSSEVIAPGWTDSVSLLWIDGDHTYEGVRRDFECWRVHLAQSAYIAFDDAVDPSLGPNKLVAEITQSGQFNHFVTIGKVVVVISNQKMKKLPQKLHPKSSSPRGYYTLINHPHKFIFFWNAKCGCSTLKKIFYEITEGDFYSGNNIHEFMGYLNSHKYFVPKENLDNYIHYKKIIVVRDPWSRLVSFYLNKTLSEKKETNIDIHGIFDSRNYSFNELVHIMYTMKPELFQHHLELQSSGIEDIEFDHVILLSEMSQKLPSILQSLGIDLDRLRSLDSFSNSTSYDQRFTEKVMHFKPQEFEHSVQLPNFHCFYDEKLIKMVAKIYERDILKFNFSYPSENDITSQDNKAFDKSLFLSGLKNYFNKTEELTNNLPNYPLIESPLFNSLKKSGNFAEYNELAEKLNKDGYTRLNIFNQKLELIDQANEEMKDFFESSKDREQDSWKQYDSVRKIATDQEILNIVERLYGKKPFAFQTVVFSKGTQEHFHSDAVLFSSWPHGFMCGVWTALEDISPDSGPLIYYPRSHKMPYIEKYHIGSQGTDQTIFDNYWNCAIDSNAYQKEIYVPKKGESLIWTANLLHGESAIKNPTLTRKSMVTYYYFDDCLYYSPILSDISSGKIQWIRPFHIPSNNDLKKIVEQKITLKENNYIIFPDWDADEETLISSVISTIKDLILYQDLKETLLLIYCNQINDEDSDLFLSTILMQMALFEEVDLEQLNITLLADPIGDFISPRKPINF